MSETSTCGFCEENGDTCSICTRHLCKSVARGQTACSPCILEAIEHKSIQRNEKGQLLDPANRTPLNTCKCGAFMYPMNPCIFKAMAGDSTHGYIR